MNFDISIILFALINEEKIKRLENN